MLALKNLTKTYKSKNGKSVTALRNVTAEFGDNGLVFILGKSGSGKSTMLNLIGGIDAPTSGEIVIDGRSSMGFKESDYDSYRNTYIGFVFQEYNLIDTYSVGKNIDLALELQGKSAEREIVDELLKKVDLVDEKSETLYGRKINELSGGQKQRVAIARALIKNPKIILADEPTGALDSETGEQLYALLKELAKDKLVIIVSHDRESAEKYGDRIIEIKDGQIAKDNEGAGKTEANTAEDTMQNTEFIKSSLPAKRTMLIGLNGLKAKKLRLVMSIILSVIAFTIFGFSIMLASVDTLATEIRTMHENDFNMYVLKSYSPKSSTITALKEYNDGREPMLVYQTERADVRINIWNYTGNANARTNSYDSLARDSLGYFAELDHSSGMEDAKLTKDQRFIFKDLCRLPQSYDEMAITDLLADYFIKYDFKSKDGLVTPIDTPDDLIGLEIEGLKICGVFSTEYGSKLKVFDKNIYEATNHENNMYQSAKDMYIRFGFVLKGFSIEKGANLYENIVLLKSTGDTAKDIGFINDINANRSYLYNKGRIYTPFSHSIDNVEGLRGSFAMTGLIMSVLFIIFSVLLTLNFLIVSINFRKRELGVLRALGARRKDVISVCLVESLSIALIEFVISLVSILIICAIFNAIFFVSVFSISFLNVLYMLLMCFGVTTIATVFPVWRISGKKPVDIINDK